jgi:hypothetical protein
MTAYQGLGRTWLMDTLLSENFPFADPFYFVSLSMEIRKKKTLIRNNCIQPWYLGLPPSASRLQIKECIDDDDEFLYTWKLMPPRFSSGLDRLPKQQEWQENDLLWNGVMYTPNATVRSEWQCINDIAHVKIADAQCHGGAGVDFPVPTYLHATHKHCLHSLCGHGDWTCTLALCPFFIKAS